MTEEHAPVATLHQADGYRFEIAFGDGIPPIASDEPPPLGSASAPSPVHLLLASVGSCMSSSLYFALAKFNNDPRGITTTTRGRIGRNEAGRLRVLEITVEIHIGAAAADLRHLERSIAQFEEFCTVGASVRQGIETQVHVYDGTGKQLK